METLLRGVALWVCNDLNYTDASIWELKGRWGSLKDQRFRSEEDFCVLADAFSQDAAVDPAQGSVCLQ